MPIVQHKKVRETIDVSKLISPTFYEDLIDLLMYKYSYLWEYGGRGSFKSYCILKYEGKRTKHKRKNENNDRN